MSTVDRKQLGLLHLYPAMAGISDADRRAILARFTGQPTSKGITQPQFEIVMAEFERVLWVGVDAGRIIDPRLCITCRRPMTRINGSIYGDCPEGCGPRAVIAWTRDHWRKRVIGDGRASSRQIWKLQRYWGLLEDCLPRDRQWQRYLAAIIAKGSQGRITSDALMDGDNIDWTRLSADDCRIAIEAIKDRLTHLHL